MKFLICVLVGVIAMSCSAVRFDSVYKGYSNKGKHSRGLAYVGDNVVVSGYNGYYAWFKLYNNEWLRRDSVLNMEDFRGVHMRTNRSLVLMNSGTKGSIWSVEFAGNKSLSYDSTGVFLDGISFYPDNDFEGVAYGDPMDSTFMMYRTMNGGSTWHQIESRRLPIILKNEAGFAASGTGIQTPVKDVIYIGTGVSDTARILRSFDGGRKWDAVNTPIRSGNHYGIYSMHFTSKEEGFVIGGSYIDSTYKEKICYYTQDRGETWVNRSEGLPGYMSCIYGNQDLSMIVATGRMGTYYSLNKGVDWNLLTETAYCSCLVTEKKVILSGRYGIFEVFNYSIKDKPKAIK
jgi:photosystem II stability/assembly factor-like uncharacterized protein